MARPRKPKVTSIHVTTYYRSGRNANGEKTGEKVLVAGSDEFDAWVHDHGDGTSRRPERALCPCEWREEESKQDRGHVRIDDDAQLQIREMMKSEALDLVKKLIRQEVISDSDSEYYQGEILLACCDAYPDHDPSQRSLKGFMKLVARNWYKNFLVRNNAQKRKAQTLVRSICQVMKDDEADDADKTSEEVLVDPRSLVMFYFMLSWDELEDLCKRKERSVLRFLFRHRGTQEEATLLLKRSSTHFRHNIMGPLQRKTDLCFAFSEMRRLKFILKKD